MYNSLNDLILRNTSSVGIKIPTSGIKLPPKDFFYGKKGIPDKEGVSVGISLIIKLQEAGCYIQNLNK